MLMYFFKKIQLKKLRMNGLVNHGSTPYHKCFLVINKKFKTEGTQTKQWCKIIKKEKYNILSRGSFMCK